MQIPNKFFCLFEDLCNHKVTLSYDICAANGVDPDRIVQMLGLT